MSPLDKIIWVGSDVHMAPTLAHDRGYSQYSFDAHKYINILVFLLTARNVKMKIKLVKTL